MITGCVASPGASDLGTQSSGFLDLLAAARPAEVWLTTAEEFAGVQLLTNCWSCSRDPGRTTLNIARPSLGSLAPRHCLLPRWVLGSSGRPLQRATALLID